MDNRNAQLFQIDLSSGVPIYRQLMVQINQRVASGTLQAGDELPSVRQAASQLNVNRMTISKAYSLLEALGILDRVRGKGMIVASDQSQIRNLACTALSNRQAKKRIRASKLRIPIDQRPGMREAMLETVLQSTADGIIVVGQSGEILAVNERFFQICRMPEEVRRTESTQRYTEYALGTLSHPQEFQAELERLNHSDEESWSIIERKDGRFFEAFSRPVILGLKQGRLWSLRDITERKRMEIELSESQSYNRCLFADSRIPLVVLDPATGCFTDCNAAAATIYGFRSREEVLGKTPADVSTEAQYDGTLSRLAASTQIKLALEKGAHNFEWRHQRPDGEIWDAEVQLMRFKHQQRGYLQFSLQDITQRRRTRRRDLLLNKLNENLLLPGTLADKTKLITDAIAGILEADFAGIWLINPGDQCSTGCLHARVAEGPHVCRNRQRCLHLAANSGRYTGLEDRIHARVPLGCCLVGSVAVGKETRFVTNGAAANPQLQDHDWARALGLPSCAGFRLQAADGSPAGVLAVFSQRLITAEHEALIESLANTASLVLQAAQAVETLRRSEDKFARAFHVSPIALIISRVTDGVIVDVNEGFCAMTGYQREEIVGRTALDVGLWENPDDHAQFVQALKTKGRVPETEFNFRTKSGRSLDCRTAAEAVYISDNQCALSIIRDITERKKAEMDLLREKQFTEKLLESLPGIFFLYDSTCHLKRWNKAHETAMGFTADELCDWYIPDWHETPEDAAKGMALVKSVLETGIGGAFETTLINKQGSFVPYLISITRLMTPEGPCMMGVGIDITERKRAEIQLRQSEERFRTLFMSMSDGFYLSETIYDENGNPCDYRYLETNPAFERISGLRRDQIVGKRYKELVPADTTHWLDAYFKVARTGLPFTYEFYSNEYQRHFETYLYQTVKGQIMVFVRDVTERKRAEIELLREKQFTEKLLESLPGIFFLYDSSCHLKRWNKAHETATGFTADELRDWHIPNWHETPEDAAKGMALVKSVLETGVGGAFETTLINKQGHFVPYLISITRLMTPEGPCMMGVGLDITQRKQAEEEKERLQAQLIQSQKIESIGRLAGGVAHDFNNMLQAILGNAALALMDLPQESPLRESLEEIQKSAQRSADLTRQLLAFARKQTIAPRALDLNEAVAGMLKMLRRLIGEDIDLVWLPGSNLGLVNMDSSQVDQLLANLCVNARDAIGGTGRITIETQNVVFDQSDVAHHPEARIGEYVRLAVSDNGSGISPEVRAHLFEPFFTTKELGQGTGLGLATVYGIVKQNDGFINVFSKQDQGTSFQIHLPRYSVRPALSAQEDSIPAPSLGQETILLVEDEPSILRVSQRLLENLGYKVLVAKSPREAIRLAREHVGNIHLLMTDVIMPEMNGHELARNLLGRYPNLKRLFMSGYTANVIAHHGVLDPYVHFIQKPFSIQALAKKVQEALNRG